MLKYKIAVDSGHGMETAGKRTPPLAADIKINGEIVRKVGEIIREKEWNRVVSDFLIAALKRCDFQVCDVAPGLSDISITKRVAAANDYCADLLISNHYNAAGDTKWWSPGYLVTFLPKTPLAGGQKAGDLVTASIAKVTPWKSNGAVKYDTYGLGPLGLLDGAKMPSMIIETGFMDVRVSAEKMLDENFAASVAEAECRAVCEFFGVNYVGTGTVPVPSPTPEPEPNPVTTPFELAVKKLVEKGVISSPDYWITAPKYMKHIDELIIKFAAAI